MFIDMSTVMYVILLHVNFYFVMDLCPATLRLFVVPRSAKIAGRRPQLKPLVNVIKKCFDELSNPLKYLFDLSLQKGAFPDSLKIARVTPIFKSGDSEEMMNYIPIYVLPCFSKILERIMYNQLFSYLQEENILYPKQFGLQNKHSTDHAIVLIVDQICECFDNKEYTLEVFIDLSKPFDTVDYSILIKKLELYGVTGTNLEWLRSYLSSRKQHILY